MKKLLLITVAAGLVACGSTSQYEWVGYQQNLYDYYNEPAKHEKIIKAHLAGVERAKGGSKKLAPGMLAEAGTFMLEKGNKAAALEFYKMELEAWPESAALMTALIINLEKELGEKP